MTIAREWLLRRGQRFIRERGEYGANNREDMLNALATTSDEDLVYEAMEGEGLDDLAEQGARSFFGGFLPVAFADIRENFDEHFPASEGDAVARQAQNASPAASPRLSTRRGHRRGAARRRQAGRPSRHRRGRASRRQESRSRHPRSAPAGGTSLPGKRARTNERCIFAVLCSNSHHAPIAPGRTQGHHTQAFIIAWVVSWPIRPSPRSPSMLCATSAPTSPAKSRCLTARLTGSGRSWCISTRRCGYSIPTRYPRRSPRNTVGRAGLTTSPRAN